MDPESNKTTAKYPPPPRHYKEFTSPHALPPPNLGTLNKLTSFKTFGSEYKIKEVNNFFNRVDSALVKNMPNEYINGIDLSNMQFFDNLDTNQSFQRINCDDLKFNVIKELEVEVSFLKERYKCLLRNMSEKLDDCLYDSALIKVSFQKIFFYISLLRKKKLVYEVGKYFEGEIEKNSLIEEKLLKNISMFQTVLIKGLQELKYSE